MGSTGFGFFPTEHYFYLMDQLIENLWFVRLVNVIDSESTMKTEIHLTSKKGCILKGN